MKKKKNQRQTTLSVTFGKDNEEKEFMESDDHLCPGSI